MPYIQQYYNGQPDRYPETNIYTQAEDPLVLKQDVHGTADDERGRICKGRRKQRPNDGRVTVPSI